MVVNERHKNFIQEQLKKLSTYDAQRPEGHVYEFHLHSQRVADNIKKLASVMKYDEDYVDALYWATLVHDIGKIDLPIHIWDIDEKPSDEIKDERRSHTWRGSDIIRREFGDDCHHDPFLKLAIEIMENHHEACDGSGYQGKTTHSLSKVVRMVCICDAFDGYSVYRPHFGDRDISPQAVIHRMEVEKAGQFDQDILNKFKEAIL